MALKQIISLLLMTGIVSATVITLGFAVYSIWVMPSAINAQNIALAPNAQGFLCENTTVQATYCSAMSINASTSLNNATLNITWIEGNGTNCRVKLVDSTLVELADLNTNQIYQLPNTYAAGSTFGLKITRIRANAGNCNLTIEPVVE